MILVTSIGGGTVEEVENDILNSKVKELWVGGGRGGGWGMGSGCEVKFKY